MKQSTKLLSFVLAILVAFSCLSVIGSAALDKSAIEYDCIDDADLSYAYAPIFWLNSPNNPVKLLNITACFHTTYTLKALFSEVLTKINFFI